MISLISRIILSSRSIKKIQLIIHFHLHINLDTKMIRFHLLIVYLMIIHD